RVDLHPLPGRPSVLAPEVPAPARGRSPQEADVSRRAFRVVVAGRPNVGKSALFNRLLRRRQSLVHDLPGVTRDVLEVEAELPDGRRYRLLDTGGYDPEGKETIPAAVRERAIRAIQGADVVLLVMDASAGVLPGDRAAARVVREAGRQGIVVA